MSADVKTRTNNPIDQYLPKHAHFSVREIATFLDVSLSTVYQMIAEGALPAIHVGGLIRVSRDKFIGWYGQVSEVEDDSKWAT